MWNERIYLIPRSDIRRKWRLGCEDNTQNTIRMDKLEEGIGDSVRPKNKFESQWESIQDCCKTSNDVRCQGLGSEENTRE